MRFLHTSDLHIGKNFYETSLVEDQKVILNQIVLEIKNNSSKNPYDALFIPGDVYDRPVPSTEAVEIFSDFLNELHKNFPELSIFVLSGNHDSPERLEFASGILKESNVYICTNTKNFTNPVILKSQNGEKCAVYMLPFLTPYSIKKSEDSQNNDDENSLQRLRTQEELYDEAVKQILQNHKKNYSDCKSVLCAHLFVSGSKIQKDSERSIIGNAEAVPCKIFEDFDYVALGHIHSCQSFGKNKNIWYSGSPLGLSFDDCGKKFMLDVNFEQNQKNCIVNKIPFVPLRNIVRLEGKFEDFTGINKNNSLIEKHKKDYVQIVFTDSTPPINGMNQLRTVFEKPMSLIPKQNFTNQNDFELKRTAFLDSEGSLDVESVLDDFFYEMNVQKEKCEKYKKIFFEVIKSFE